LGLTSQAIACRRSATIDTRCFATLGTGGTATLGTRWCAILGGLVMFSGGSGFFLGLALQALRIGVLGVGDDFEILVLENGHGKSDFGVLDASVKGFVDGFEPLGARVLYDVANCFEIFKS
jgi:hypothetical protein